MLEESRAVLVGMIYVLVKVSKLQHGKKKCVVIAAVANRWVRRLYYQMTHSEVAVSSA